MNNENNRRGREYDLPEDYIPQIKRKTTPSVSSFGSTPAPKAVTPNTPKGPAPRPRAVVGTAMGTATSAQSTQRQAHPLNSVSHAAVSVRQAPSPKSFAPVAPELSAYESAEKLHSNVRYEPAVVQPRAVNQSAQVIASQSAPALKSTVDSRMAAKNKASQNESAQSTPKRSAPPSATPSSSSRSSSSAKAVPAKRNSVRRAAQDTGKNKSRTRTIDKVQISRTKNGAGQDNGSENSSTVFNLIKAMIYIVVVIAVSGLLSYYAIVFGNDMYAFVKSDEEVEVSIPEYATVEEIAEILGDSGVVKYPNLLVLYAKLKKIDKTYEFVAGDYTVNGMMNYDELFYAFVKSKSYETVRLTIPEGYTVDEIIKLFTDNGIGTREGFVDVINNYDFEFDFVKALDGADLQGRTYRLEGYLYPDTYDFYKSSSEVTVIYKLLNRFNTIYSEEFYAKSAELGYTVDEMITLASMIEKEARYAGDYENVSSVFHNRLNNPANYPRLESDATIMYAIQVRDGERKGKLTGEDLKYDTPYNSYMYNGLPPGPIANPGYEAITCALYPAKTKYYYFVSDSYGNTYFSSTLAQHNAAKEKVKQIDG